MASILDFRRTCLALATVMALSGFAGKGGAQTGNVPVSRTTGGADPIRQAAALARADSAWQAGSYLLATELYEAVLARDSSSHIALFRLATLRSWDNRFDEGIALFRRYVALEPNYTEGRLSLARTIAWSGQYASAIAVYDSVLTREPRNRDAVLGRAQTLAWSGRLSDALAVYRQWTTAHPTDRNASIDYARTLAWNGQTNQAETMYEQLAKTGNADAKKGLARLIGWRGDLARSEETWRQVLITDPADPEALTGLAQVLNWEGRNAEAAIALQDALRANPSYGDARALLRLVRAELDPTVTVAVIGVNDSEKNRATTLLVDYVARALWNGAIGARYTRRSADFSATDARSDGVNVFGRWQPGTWQFRADAGVTRHSSTPVPVATNSRTIGNAAVSVGGKIGRALNFGVSASRAPFDETALLIANGVVTSVVGGETAIALPARLTLSGAASHARFTGGTRPNSRDGFSSTLRWTLARRWSLAVGGYQYGYDTTTVDGYFAPRRYTLAEASGRGRVGGEVGWNADVDVGLGRQTVELFGSSRVSRLAERAGLNLGYRFDPSHELSASGGYANVAGPGQSGGSEYKAYAFSLRARAGF